LKQTVAKIQYTRPSKQHKSTKIRHWNTESHNQKARPVTGITKISSNHLPSQILEQPNCVGLDHQTQRPWHPSPHRWPIQQESY